jgi:hypothetical protein
MATKTLVKKTPVINAGEDKIVTAELSAVDPCSDCSGPPFNITGATEIVALFPSGTTPIQKKLSLSEITIINAGGGMVAITLTAADTLLLDVGLIDVEIRVTIAGKTSIAQISQQITVNASMFPGV